MRKPPLRGLRMFGKPFYIALIANGLLSFAFVWIDPVETGRQFLMRLVLQASLSVNVGFLWAAQQDALRARQRAVRPFSGVTRAPVMVEAPDGTVTPCTAQYIGSDGHADISDLRTLADEPFEPADGSRLLVGLPIETDEP